MDERKEKRRKQFRKERKKDRKIEIQKGRKRNERKTITRAPHDPNEL